MTLESEKIKQVLRFLQSAYKQDCPDLQVEWRPLRGGLDSKGVFHVRAKFRGACDKPMARSFVIKQVAAQENREAEIYATVLSRISPNYAPALLWCHENGEDHLLFLEAVQPATAWPWRNTHQTHQVLAALAEFHQHKFSGEAPQWDYEESLLEQGRKLIDLLQSTDPNGDLGFARKFLPAVRRLVQSLPEFRRQILEDGPLPSTFIHGDVHPGNVMLRKQRSQLQPVFLDWGRGRVGSPLEDVSSWLQSLGYWEPEARRRHDTLLSAYLRARGFPGHISRAIRDAYWLAAASNLLAGAAVYHYVVANDPVSDPASRERARHALRDCLRVFRRADACWTA